MKILLKVLRSLVIALPALFLMVPVILYILFCLPAVQRVATEVAEKELTRLLGTDVEIGQVEFAPFNRLVLTDVCVRDLRDSTLMQAGHLGAGVSFIESLSRRQWVVTYAELIDLKLHLYRDSAGAPLNIEPIIKRFQSKPKRESSKFDIAVNMVVVRRSEVSYDVLDVARPPEGVFSPAHIRVDHLRADLRVPRISNDRIEATLKRLGAHERSGLTLSDLSGSVELTREGSYVKDFTLAMPATELKLAEVRLASVLGKGFSLKNLATTVELLPGSRVSTADFAPLVPQLAGMNLSADVTAQLHGSPSDFTVNSLKINIPQLSTALAAEGAISGLTDGKNSISYKFDKLKVSASVPAVRQFMLSAPALAAVGAKIPESADALGNVELDAAVSGSLSDIDTRLSLATACGDVEAQAQVSKQGASAPLAVKGSVSTTELNPSALLPALSPLTSIQLSGEADLRIQSGKVSGSASTDIPSAVWNGHELTGITAAATLLDSHLDASVTSATPGLDFSIEGSTDLDAEAPATKVMAEIRHIALSQLVKGGEYKDFHLSTALRADILGKELDEITGSVCMDNLRFTNRSDRTLHLPQVELNAVRVDSIRHIRFNAGPVSMDLDGRFSYKDLAHSILTTFAETFPALASAVPQVEQTHACAQVDARLSVHMDADSTICRFFRLPIDVIYPVSLHAASNSVGRAFSLYLDAPYLRQGKKVLEGTNVAVYLNGIAGKCSLSAKTILPGKGGPMQVQLLSSGGRDALSTKLKWGAGESRVFTGAVELASQFRRDERGNLITNIDFVPTQVTVNDSVWSVTPGSLRIAPDMISMAGVGAERAGQHIRLNGTLGRDSLDRMVVSLRNFDLDYLFETLNIGEAVMFGGRATGDFYGDALLSSQPRMFTPRLKVKGFKYNHAVMGDADIRSAWDNATQGITIDADVTQANGEMVTARGMIRPVAGELDFRFKANRTSVQFLQPFLRSFTSKLSGEVSGDVHLFGPFSRINLEGDAFAQDFTMHVDYINVDYTVTDSVHIRPGLIKFDNLTVRDPYGNTAKFNGQLTHYFFRDMVFRFDITEAHNILAYNVSERESRDPWYGRVFADGSVTLRGVPSRVDIEVNMATGPNSTFAFRTSGGSENTSAYDFVTLRDARSLRRDTIAEIDPTPASVRQLRERISHEAEGPRSTLGVDLNIDVNPNATLMLVMNPAGGDKITAQGSGHVRLNYQSDADVQMFGEYTLRNGLYNFTLQDLIIKDFNIREGSKITFLGNPEAAQLDIVATHTVNANLSDLDESFLQDRELNRTNVRVNAMLLVTGDIRQPEVNFDLEFPTLSRDMYRKVRSIVSTDDMMNRQIIYLLALNRFYTPDYMTTTHGNELVSVASSTISSRLSSMLGQLSDHWSIAPAFRSDRGDFSDVEVDVALSSQLLNNRLLLNGNFGYRDKALNNNNFIGDFDLRYLLNRSGSIQVKAYNRYNDQNYYYKNALTTQGVGLVFRKDFDSFRSLFRKKEAAAADTVPEKK